MGKLGFSGKKPTLSAYKVGLVYLRKLLLSSSAYKVGLSAQADKDCFPDSVVFFRES